MFGSTKHEIERAVAKGKWEKIFSHYVQSKNTEDRLNLAVACGTSNDDGALNVLDKLVSDKELKVQLAALESIGKVGSEEHSSTKLRWLMDHTPADQAELLAAIHKALEQLHK